MAVPFTQYITLDYQEKLQDTLKGKNTVWKDRASIKIKLIWQKMLELSDWEVKTIMINTVKFLMCKVETT